MTEQEMNMAIAEAVGKQPDKNPDRVGKKCPVCDATWKRRYGRYCLRCHGTGRLSVRVRRTPPYTTDFNAMHEAVATLSFTQRRLYRLELQRVVSSGLKEGVLVEMSECIDATARQRAEAFLRTVGRWTE